MQPLISIITINFNNAIGLEKTIMSVVNQSFTGFEYIIIDGASTDSSVEIIKKYGNSINYWVSEKDSGIYNAMNKGIKVAKGQYLLFLNSGDFFYSDNSLSFFLPSINKKEPKDLIYGSLCTFENEEIISKFPEKITFFDFVHNPIPHPCTLINIKLFDNELYDENLKIVSDWKFFLNSIIKHKALYERIDAVIAIFDTNGISSTKFSESKDLIYNEKTKVFLEEFAVDFNDLKNIKTNIYKVNFYESEKVIKVYLKIKKRLKNTINS